MSAPGGADPVAPVGGGMFEVNIAEAPRAIRELEAALEELRNLRQDASQLGHIDPPALDPVTVDAAGAIGRTAAGTPESLFQALEAGIAELERMIQALRSGFDAYANNDDGARTRLSIKS